MKKIILLFSILFLLSSNSWAEQKREIYREDIDDEKIIHLYEPVWIDAPDNDIAKLLITGEKFKIALANPYLTYPYDWDIYSSKYASADYNNTVNLLLSVYADKDSYGTVENINLYASSNNPLVPARGIVADSRGTEAITIFAISDNMPAKFLGLSETSKVLVDCDLEVTGIIINSQVKELEKRIAELERKLAIPFYYTP